MIRTNGITTEDYVCQEGTQDSYQIKQIPELNSGPHVIPAPPLPTKRKKPLLQRISKWTVIGWSLICLFGVISGMANAGKHLNENMNDYEKAGAGIGVGIGLFIWLVLWAVITLPALLVWVVSKLSSKND